MQSFRLGTIFRWVWVVVSVLVATASIMSTSNPTAAQDVTPSPLISPDNAALIAALAQDGAVISYHAQTGKVRFIGAGPSQVVSQPAALLAQATAEDAARGFLSAYGGLFGVNDSRQELVLMHEKIVPRGRSFVRFQQVYNGIPIIGGELIVQLNDRFDVLSANGEVLPDIALSTTPTVTADSARQTALAAVAKWYGVDANELTVSQPELWIYSPSLIGPGTDSTKLVWRVEVKPVELGPIWELILIDAERGTVPLHFNQIDTAMNRNTYSANNGTSLPGTLLCTEFNPTCSGFDAHAVAAHTYAGDTYEFYSTTHGRDSINNAGMALVSTVHFGTAYENAFWNGSQMVYGDGYGFPLADDVVAHELTHGITQYESNLFYYYQSGAINESLSDVWGEFIDLTNGAGNDTPAVRWQMGEDVAGLGVIRSMSDPTALGDPDRMTSPYYYEGALDNGGVHTNSGVNNKAAYLMADGGTFNGQTVTGLGITKAAKIYYEVQTNLLTSGADYADLYDALYQACLNLVGTAGITTGDCQEVRDATNAVEMNQQPAPNFNSDAPLCPTGQSVESILFSDDFESGYSTKWIFGATVGSNRWGHVYGFAHSGLYSLYATDYPAAVTSSYTAMKANVNLPPNAYLHFAHAYGFEDPYYDGGVLEYSTNNGGTWKDAGGLFDVNGYKGAISPYFGNPLAGRSAFISDSHGYVSSRLNLGSLAGQNVRFRWMMGIDSVIGDLGWVLDDVQIYTCVSVAAPSNLQAAGVSFSEIMLTWADQSTDETEFRIERSLDGVSGWTHIDTVGANVTSYSDTSISCGLKYYYRVRAFRDSDNGLSNPSNTASVTVPCSPSGAAPQLNYFTTSTPTLTWNRVPGADEYEIQVDTASNFAAPVIFTTTVSGTTLAVTTPPLPDGLYYWRVRAKKGSSTGAWSVVDTFFVDAP